MHLYRVERIVIRRSDPQYKACVRLCQCAKRPGNCAAYTLRQNLFQGKPFLSRTDLDKQLRAEYGSDYRAMPPAASAQRQGQIIHEQLKAFFASSAEYKSHPEKFRGRPRLPGYAKRFRTFVVGRNGYKIEDSMLIITGSEKSGFEPVRVRCCENQVFNARREDAVTGDLRICPKGNTFIIELTCRREVPDNNPAVLLNRDNALAIDSGIDNLAACSPMRPGVPPLLIRGGALKSVNQWWNKRTAVLRSEGKYGHIGSITFRRSCRIGDLMHKASHAVITYCKVYDIGTIIIGLNPDWKQRCGMGRVNNQKFVFLPHRELIGKICYKAEELGIRVIIREESYTSKASSPDFDPLPASCQDGASYRFSGRRIRRGLYRTKSGRVINADLNGSINLARKEPGDGWLRSLIADGGLVDRPVVIRNLHDRLDCAALLKRGYRASETTCVSMW